MPGPAAGAMEAVVTEAAAALVQPGSPGLAQAAVSEWAMREELATAGPVAPESADSLRAAEEAAVEEALPPE